MDYSDKKSTTDPLKHATQLKVLSEKQPQAMLAVMEICWTYSVPMVLRSTLSELQNILYLLSC